MAGRILHVQPFRLLSKRRAAATLAVVALALAIGLPFAAGAETQEQAPGVTRALSATEVSPGETVTVTLSPHGFSGFYAVKEVLGGLAVTGHSADNFESGVFIMLQPEPFTYEVRVPESAEPGDELPISGQWWTDPADKRAVTPPNSLLTVNVVADEDATTPTPTSVADEDAMPPTATPAPDEQAPPLTATPVVDEDMTPIPTKTVVVEEDTAPSATAIAVQGEDVTPTPIEPAAKKGEATGTIATTPTPDAILHMPEALSVVEGGKLDVPITLSDIPAGHRVAAYNLTVTFDPDVIHLQAARGGEAPFDSTPISRIDNGRGTARLSSFHTQESPPMGEIVIARLHATAAGAPGSCSTLGIVPEESEITSADGSKILFTANEGRFCVEEAPTPTPAIELDAGSTSDSATTSQGKEEQHDGCRYSREQPAGGQ